MSEEDQQANLRTTFDLKSYDHDRGAAVFQQRLIDEHTGTFHAWSMDVADWDSIGRPLSFVMTITPEDR